MKNTFLKKLAIVTILAFGALSFTACSNDENSDNSFTGENMIVLKAINTNTMQDNGTDKIEIEVLLVTALNETLDLEFALSGNKVEGQIIADIENPKITIQPGQKKAILTITNKTKRVLKEATKLKLELVKNSSKLRLEKPFEITVTPLSFIDALTPAQIELLDGYKKQGLDLYPLMGEIDVTGEIDFPGSEYLTPLNQPKRTIVKGTTLITLSEKATAQKPVLKMISNPMGAEAYLYELFKSVSINDKEFWAEETNVAHTAVMKLIGLTSSSEETFQVTLDDIEIDLKTKAVKFTKEATLYDEPITIVGFDYNYSAWNRLKKLLDEKNPIAIENYEMGGTVNPSEIINTGTITKNQYDTKDWKESVAKLTDDKLTFHFIMDHITASGYVQFKIEYKLK
ncbi:DUF4929 family protein [Flavobacterium poyangense]|uniref:DUF4929 family protein n=1 Tax=Flavobacterium poyangense TaxID=2204302 RepID=UPI00141F54DF|nr:DUF4929 family protein [Flavobacterium sp. JXAS1]